MKNLVLMFLVGTSLLSFKSVDSISWEKTSMDLGVVKPNEEVALSFKFRNDSDQPVNILEAKGSCGCTVVNMPKQAIAPGAEADIDATFKSSKVGQFKKSITVRVSTSEDPIILNFSGEIK